MLKSMLISQNKWFFFFKNEKISKIIFGFLLENLFDSSIFSHPPPNRPFKVIEVPIIQGAMLTAGAS